MNDKRNHKLDWRATAAAYHGMAVGAMTAFLAFPLLVLRGTPAPEAFTQIMIAAAFLGPVGYIATRAFIEYRRRQNGVRRDEPSSHADAPSCALSPAADSAADEGDGVPTPTQQALILGGGILLSLGFIWAFDAVLRAIGLVK